MYIKNILSYVIFGNTYETEEEEQQGLLGEEWPKESYRSISRHWTPWESWSLFYGVWEWTDGERIAEEMRMLCSGRWSTENCEIGRPC